MESFEKGQPEVPYANLSDSNSSCTWKPCRTVFVWVPHTVGAALATCLCEHQSLPSVFLQILLSPKSHNKDPDAMKSRNEEAEEEVLRV